MPAYTATKIVLLINFHPYRYHSIDYLAKQAYNGILIIYFSFLYFLYLVLYNWERFRTSVPVATVTMPKRTDYYLHGECSELHPFLWLMFY